MNATLTEAKIQPIAQQLTSLQIELNIQQGIAHNAGIRISNLTQQLATYENSIDTYIKRASDPQFLGNPNSPQVKDAKAFGAQKIKDTKNQIESAQREKVKAQAEVERLKKQAAILTQEGEAEYQTLINKASSLAGVLGLAEMMANDTLSEIRAIATQLGDLATPLHKQPPLRIADAVKVPGVWIEEGV
jgi:hypothetical protein